MDVQFNFLVLMFLMINVSPFSMFLKDSFGNKVLFFFKLKRLSLACYL